MALVLALVRRPFTPWVLAATVGVAATACGGPIVPDPPPAVVILDTTVPLAQGVNCNAGYVGAEFTATTGRFVTISVSGPVNLTPLFILSAPDFATQLGVSSPAGPGAAAFAFIPAQTGLHHLSICDVNGVAGTLKVVVNQR